MEILSVVLDVLLGAFFGLRLFTLGALILIADCATTYFKRKDPVEFPVKNLLTVCGIIGGLDLIYNCISTFEAYYGVGKYAAIISSVLAVAGLFAIYTALYDKNR